MSTPETRASGEVAVSTDEAAEGKEVAVSTDEAGELQEETCGEVVTSVVTCTALD